jgi:hypothetical protein
MSQSTRSGTQAHTKIAGDLLTLVTRTVEQADAQAAAERVAALRKARADAIDQELVDMLIKRKCKRTGAVGAVTSGTSLIPGLGTLAALTIGVAADVSITFVAQVDLVLEIAAVYGQRLDPAAKKRAVLVATGVSSGTNRLLNHAGGLVVGTATRRFTRRFFVKAIPVVGVGASVAGNVLATRVIGQRANAYFGLGPDAVGSWADSVRAVVGVDERQIIARLSGASGE